jgi:membrane protease YdiL (CAAX protease family)
VAQLVMPVVLFVPAAILTHGAILNQLRNLSERGASPMSWVFWGLILAASCGAGAFALFLLSRTRRTDATLIGFGNKPASGSWKWLLVACAAVPALWLLGSMESALWRLLNLGPSSTSPLLLSLAKTGGWALFLAIAAIVIVGPIAEELLFRGLLLGKFRAHGYLVSGTILSAVVFSLAHGNPRHFLELSAIGLLLAWLYLRNQFALALDRTAFIFQCPGRGVCHHAARLDRVGARLGTRRKVRIVPLCFAVAKSDSRTPTRCECDLSWHLSGSSFWSRGPRSG